MNNKRNELTPQQIWEALNDLDAKVFHIYCIDYNYTRLFMVGAVKPRRILICYISDEQPKNVWVTRY